MRKSGETEGPLLDKIHKESPVDSGETKGETIAFVCDVASSTEQKCFARPHGGLCLAAILIYCILV